MEGGVGGHLAIIESDEELSHLNDIIHYSTESLPRRGMWYTGAFTDPHGLTSTASLYEKTYVKKNFLSHIYQ
jgi:hypothetical protein